MVTIKLQIPKLLELLTVGNSSFTKRPIPLCCLPSWILRPLSNLPFQTNKQPHQIPLPITQHPVMFASLSWVKATHIITNPLVFFSLKLTWVGMLRSKPSLGLREVKMGNQTHSSLHLGISILRVFDTFVISPSATISLLTMCDLCDGRRYLCEYVCGLIYNSEVHLHFS